MAVCYERGTPVLLSSNFNFSLYSGLTLYGPMGGQFHVSEVTLYSSTLIQILNLAPEEKIVIALMKSTCELEASREGSK